MASVGQIYYNVLDAINQENPSYEDNLISNISSEVLYGENGNNIVTSYQGATQFNKIGIQAPPGTQVILNSKSIMIGRTGIYELDDDIVITYMAFVKPKHYVQDTKAIHDAIEESTGIFRQSEIDKENAMTAFYQQYGTLPAQIPSYPQREDYDTEEEYEAAMAVYQEELENYVAAYNAYKDIQDAFIASYEPALSEYNQGINGIYVLDPDNPYEDLYNVIIDFIYE